MSSFSKKHPQALVIGAGVNRLTSALCLEEEGFKVTVMQKTWRNYLRLIVGL